MTAYRKNARNSLSDLDLDEKTALATLIRVLVRADGEVSEDEREEIERIASEAGRDDFWKLLDAAAEVEDEDKSVAAQIERITSSDAQELIYGALYELSIADGSGEGENDLLDRLQQSWKLSIHDESPEE